MCVYIYIYIYIYIYTYNRQVRVVQKAELAGGGAERPPYNFVRVCQDELEYPVFGPRAVVVTLLSPLFFSETPALCSGSEVF